ncbi:MAG: hypothetical protein KDJ80_09410 [Nitratireductor sp.]|nr:hypothetical protein [Nitratireductor sp.]
MAAKRKTSGLEKVPPILSRPLWKDSLIRWGILAAAFWMVVLWLIFG